MWRIDLVGENILGSRRSPGRGELAIQLRSRLLGVPAWPNYHFRRRPWRRYTIREVVLRRVGRPSIAPEGLLRSLLLQIFYSVRSEGMLIEQLQYNLLFRWFVGMEMDEVVWNHAVFSKNRERLLNEEIAEVFFDGCWNVLSRICRMNISWWTGH
jgi:hypothetical protein